MSAEGQKCTEKSSVFKNTRLHVDKASDNKIYFQLLVCQKLVDIKDDAVTNTALRKIVFNLFDWPNQF